MTAEINGLEFGIATSDPGGVLSGFTPAAPFTMILGSGIGDISVAAFSGVSDAVVVGSVMYFYDGVDSVVRFDIVENSANDNLVSVSLADSAFRDVAEVMSGYVSEGPLAGIGPRSTAFRYALHPSVPNPFDNSTLIRYELARKDQVRLAVYSVEGERVRSLVDQALQDAGPHSVRWDGRDDSGRKAAPGVYFYRLETGRFSKTRCMTLIR